ncbi:HRDC domain-containing protein, partial [Vibrio natriegens]
VVFNDATLMEMAERLPTSAGALLTINGVGQRKLEKYGTAFMNVIEDHLTVGHDMPYAVSS